MPVVDPVSRQPWKRRIALTARLRSWVHTALGAEPGPRRSYQLRVRGMVARLNVPHVAADFRVMILKIAPEDRLCLAGAHNENPLGRAQSLSDFVQHRFVHSDRAQSNVVGPAVQVVCRVQTMPPRRLLRIYMKRSVSG